MLEVIVDTNTTKLRFYQSGIVSRTTEELLSSSLSQDGNTSSRVSAEVKHLGFSQSSDGSNLLRSGKCCGRKVGNMRCPFEIPFPLGPVPLVHFSYF